jgi:hypothetical protein
MEINEWNDKASFSYKEPVKLLAFGKDAELNGSSIILASS